LPSETRRALEILAEKVRTFGGRLEEVSPTGMVAAFGLEPAEDAPSRAVLCAMALEKAVEHGRRGNTQMRVVTVGIHVGQFMVGWIGALTEIDLEAKRQAWSLLEGLVQRADPGTIVVTEAAAAFLTRRFELVPAGPPDQTGAQVYRVVGRSRTGFGVGGRVTPFVGRRDELELLRGRFAAAMRGQGQVLGIVGEPGIGKSRLLFELRESLARERVIYLEGRCLSYGSVIPYLPILDLVRQNCGIGEADLPEVVAEKVRQRLQALEVAPDDWSPYLLRLLEVPEGRERLASLSPEAIKARTFETLCQMTLAAPSAHCPGLGDALSRNGTGTA